MRVVLILLFSVFVYANNLVDNINQYIDYNMKINDLNILLGKNEDKTINQNKINQEISEYKNKKNQILSILPTLFDKNNLNNKLLEDFKKEKISSELKKIKLEFYKTLIESNNVFNDSKIDNESIKDIIDESIKELNSEKVKDEELVYLNSYIEILTYLRLNANVFESNYLIQELKTDNFINYLNGFFPKEVSKYLNPGKIIICCIILLFIFMFKKIILKLIYFVFLKLIKKQKHEINESLKDITKPLTLLFYMYGIWLCFVIAFYPAAVMPIILTILSIINTIIIAWLILNIINSYGLILMSKLALKSGKKEIINLILKIIDFIIIIITILIILAKLGFDISAIIASLGIGGLAVALAAKDIIANFFASVLMLFDNSFSQSDWVEVNGIEGTIVETGLRKTTIRTFDNCLVFIPNSTILNGNIKNYSKRKYGRRVKLSVGLTYDSTTEQIQNFINDLKELLNNNEIIANENDEIFQHKNKNFYKQNLISVNDLEGFKSSIYVWLDDFAASSINVELYFYIKSISAKQYYDEKSKILMEVMKIVEKNGLSFAFPSTSLYVEKLPKD